MKKIAATLFGISTERLDEYKNRANTEDTRVDIEVFDTLSRDNPVIVTNFRRLLQHLGNDAIKPVFGDDVWANLMQSSINKSTADIILIPDCRFRVELELIGGVTVRVFNPSVPVMNHTSEIELSDVMADFTLDNADYKATTEDIANLAERIINASLPS